MKILSWNVLLTNPDADAIAGYIESLSPDACALQELSPHHIDRLARLPGYDLVLAEDFIEDGALTHLGILTRLPHSDVRVIDHNAARAVSPSMVGRRNGWVECLQSLSVRLETAAGPVRLVNLHLSAAAPPAHRARELSAADAHLGDDARSVVCGDMNSWSRPLLNLAVGWAYGVGPGALFDSDRRVLDDFRARHGLARVFPPAVTLPRFGLHLDHIFVRGLAAEAREVVRDTHGSDHRPLVAQLGPDAG